MPDAEWFCSQLEERCAFSTAFCGTFSKAHESVHGKRFELDALLEGTCRHMLATDLPHLWSNDAQMEPARGCAVGCDTCLATPVPTPGKIYVTNGPRNRGKLKDLDDTHCPEQVQ